ncbi:MAG: peptidoglycan-binding protein [Spirulina sp. SIO3F2]|nr:peptidoglycan-binding protein [Spirulina sp. SIO3F2]
MFNRANQVVYQRNDYDNLIKQIQTSLNARGFTVGGQVITCDGLFGPQTEEAIKYFQTDHGERATGKVTRRQLSILLSEESDSENSDQSPERNPLLTFLQSRSWSTTSVLTIVPFCILLVVFGLITLEFDPAQMSVELKPSNSCSSAEHSSVEYKFLRHYSIQENTIDHY